MQSRHLVENFSRQCPVCKKPRPSFICGSVGAFSLPFWGELNRGAHWRQAIFPGSVSFAGALEKMLCREAVFLPAGGQKRFPGSSGRPYLGVVAEKIWRFVAHIRDAARPDTVPSRLPGACAASAPRAGHWRTRLRYRRHWPPGPWRNGRIWNCPWLGRPGASIR